MKYLILTLIVILTVAGLVSTHNYFENTSSTKNIQYATITHSNGAIEYNRPVILVRSKTGNYYELYDKSTLGGDISNVSVCDNKSLPLSYQKGVTFEYRIITTRNNKVFQSGIFFDKNLAEDIARSSPGKNKVYKFTKYKY